MYKCAECGKEFEDYAEMADPSRCLSCYERGTGFCGKCHGTGQDENVPGWVSAVDMNSNEGIPFDCPRCGGTGKAKIRGNV